MGYCDLETLSLKELKQLQRDVAKAIATFEERQKAEARAKVDALAREMGFSLVELADSDARPTRAAPVPKYRDPANPGNTWSGRGRKPRWFVEALAAGRSAADLEIG